MEEINQQPSAPAPEELTSLRDKVSAIRDEVDKVIIGQGRVVNLLMTGLLTGGHILLEGVPGIAKTLLAKTLTKTIQVNFSRIQFTPDMMPTDVIGTSVFNLKTSEFVFNRGPIFSNLVLIDEINRAPAKTQASLFEVMEERQITVDGTTYAMDFPFLVVATQNPIEQEGTYRLPEAQLDRFLFRIRLSYPTLEQEIQILKKYQDDFSGSKARAQVNAVLKPEELHHFQHLVERIHIKEDVLAYIARITEQTRTSGSLSLGASPRASLAMLKSAKAMAALQGRNFVTPDDVKLVADPVLNHRIILSADREMEGLDASDMMKEIIEKIEVPR